MSNTFLAVLAPDRMAFLSSLALDYWKMILTLEFGVIRLG